MKKRLKEVLKELGVKDCKELTPDKTVELYHASSKNMHLVREYYALCKDCNTKVDKDESGQD